eukprot:g75882.t1
MNIIFTKLIAVAVVLTDFGFRHLQSKECDKLECFARQRPYPQLGHHEAAVKVRDNNLRPHIPSDWPRGYAQLMKECWDKRPEKRPSMQEVCTRLKELEESLAGHQDGSASSVSFFPKYSSTESSGSNGATPESLASSLMPTDLAEQLLKRNLEVQQLRARVTELEQKLNSRDPASSSSDSLSSRRRLSSPWPQSSPRRQSSPGRQLSPRLQSSPGRQVAKLQHKASPSAVAASSPSGSPSLKFATISESVPEPTKRPILAGNRSHSTQELQARPKPRIVHQKSVFIPPLRSDSADSNKIENAVSFRRSVEQTVTKDNTT